MLDTPIDDLHVLAEPEAAAPLFEPVRRRILELLDRPDSAAGIARRLGQPRQKVNYHLRELERTGLVELSEERRRGNCTERVMRRRAHRYLVSPASLGPLGAGSIEDERPTRGDRFSWSYLVSVLARAIRELAELRRRAIDQGRRLPTVSLESEIRFRSPSDFEAFTEELAASLRTLIEKYDRPDVEGARAFRWLSAGYPLPASRTDSAGSETGERP